jgi:hypothetical protein
VVGPHPSLADTPLVGGAEDDRWSGWWERQGGTGDELEDALLLQRQDGTPLGLPQREGSARRSLRGGYAVRFMKRPGSTLMSGGSSAGAHPATAAAITYFVATPRSR